jgi:predicted AAA+ superfamily ATPase
MDRGLAEWRSRPDRKPLVLRGARQTGKSTTVKEFGKQFEAFLELNLERRADLSLVRSCSSVEDLLIALATRNNLARLPDRTLLFLDEVQESPELISWLRFFQEDHPELAVIAAGSLLEVRFRERGFSFPVGRVTFRTLHPLTYMEFLRALGRDALADRLLGSLREIRPIPRPLHEEALALLRDYLLVGGMPEAVSQWIGTGLPGAVREVHDDLLQALAEDFQKYRGVRNLDNLEAAFENLKFHYGTRFAYENFAPGRRSRAMQTALGRLESALLIKRVLPTSDLKLPLRPRRKAAPKLLPLDVGLALSSTGTAIDELRTLPIEKLLDGRLAEMFAGGQITAGRPGRDEQLYFWVRDSARAGAEVDLLLPGAGVPVPVEVKSGASGTLRSMHQFLWRAGQSTGLRQPTGLRLSARELSDEILEAPVSGQILRYRLISVPIYMAEAVWGILEELGS